MSKIRRRIDENQHTIFELIKDLSSSPSSSRGEFKIIDNLRDAMRAAIKASPLSRYQIAGEMSNLLSETITKEQIDSWTREDQRLDDGRQTTDDGGQGEDRWIRRHIPAEYLPAFCQTTGNTEPLKVMGGPCGIFIMPGPEALRAEIQKLDEEIRETQAKKKKRMMFLKEMEKD